MANNILKSIGAVVGGLAVTVALSYGTDAILSATGAMPKGRLPVYGSVVLVATVLVYRTIYNVLGCYIAARLAPSHPFRHAMILGGIGFLGSVGGLFAASGKGLGPMWYAWGLVLLALPAAWLGGKLYTGFTAKK